MKPTRRKAREVALQALYWRDVNPDANVNDLRRFVHDRMRFAGLEEFIWTRVMGIDLHRVEIDAWIAGAAANWSVSRMPSVDRNILRLAGYEIRYGGDIPAKVAIDEALELCKRYSTRESVAFVNGVLDCMAGLSDDSQVEMNGRPPGDTRDNLDKPENAITN